MSTVLVKKYFANADEKSIRQKFNLRQSNLLVRDGHQDGGMHKSFKHNDKGCVWNEDAPAVVSCAHFRLLGSVVIFAAGSFCVLPYRSDGKDNL